MATPEGWKFESKPTAFSFWRGRVRFNARLGADGRWYGNCEVSGRVTHDFNYASRGSVRRAIIQHIDRQD